MASSIWKTMVQIRFVLEFKMIALLLFELELNVYAASSAPHSCVSLPPLSVLCPASLYGQTSLLVSLVD